MAQVLVFYGSYRQSRQGLRLAERVVETLRAAGTDALLIDAKAVDLPMLDLRFSDYAPGEAPANMAALSAQISACSGCLLVAGEYNGGPQPGLKNLVDHYYKEWDGKLCGVITYSSGRLAGVKAGQSWGPIVDKLGMLAVPGAPAAASLAQTLDENGQPIGEAGARLQAQLEKYLRKFTGLLKLNQG